MLSDSLGGDSSDESLGDYNSDPNQRADASSTSSDRVSCFQVFFTFRFIYPQVARLSQTILQGLDMGKGANKDVESMNSDKHLRNSLPSRSINVIRPTLGLTSANDFAPLPMFCNVFDRSEIGVAVDVTYELVYGFWVPAANVNAYSEILKYHGHFLPEMMSSMLNKEAR